MLWLTWRQHRGVVLVTAALLLGLGGFLLVHGMQTANIAEGYAPGSAELEQALGERYDPVYQVINWLVIAPAVVGVFWGAPVLAREVERGTHKLAWTQSVPRHRWLLTKLVFLGALAAAGGLALGLMVKAWSSTFSGTPFASDLSLFWISGAATAGWWLFAFAVGITVGALIPRMLPAMAITIAVIVVVLPFSAFVRQYYAQPEQVVLGANDEPPDALLNTGREWQHPDGRPLTPTAADAATRQHCGPTQERIDYSDCLLEHGYRLVVSYQPENRFWQFQWTEAGALLVFSLGLGGLALRRASRHSF